MKKIGKKTRQLFYSTLLLFACLTSIKSQTANSVGIGTILPHASALLHLESPNQGFLMTRQTTSQIMAISSPTNGLIVYNTDDQCYWYKRIGYWARLCNTDSINSKNVTSNTATINNLTVNIFHGDTIITNYVNFGNGYGDSIFVHYLRADTAFIKQLTTHTIKTDSLYIGGNSIQTIIKDSIIKNAWLLKGNTGTNPVVNFLGTIDNKDLVIRTNNTENVRVLNTGETGFGTNTPTEKVDINGNIRIRNGANSGYILQSDNLGTGSWIPPASLFSIVNLNSNAWTTGGNYGTNPAFSFLGTIDNQDMVVRTNNVEKVRILTTGETGFGTNTPTEKVDVNGQIRLRTGAVNGYILQSNATGVGTWTPLSSIVTSTVINNSGWTILGNTGTNPSTNFFGTIDNQHLVIRTNNVEKIRVLNTGETGFGTNTPTEKVDVNGQIRLRTGATNGYILQSNATGVGTWTSVASVVSILPPATFNNNAWTILGNSGTSPSTNFIGTTDNQDFVIRTNNALALQVTKGTAGTAEKQILAITHKKYPQYSFLNDTTTGLLYDNAQGFFGSVNPYMGLLVKGKELVALDYRNNSYYSQDGTGSVAGVSNIAIGSGTIDVNCNANVNYFSNHFKNNASNMFVMNWSASGSDFNVIDDGQQGFLVGRNNTYSNGAHGFLMGSFNTLKGLLNVTRSGISLLGNDNVVNSYYGSNLIAGESNTVTAVFIAPIGGRAVSGNVPPVSNIIGGYNTTSATETHIFGSDNTNTHANTVLIGYGVSSFANRSIAMSGAGGTRIYSNTLNNTGVSLAPGGGAWASVSDRRLKENIQNISNRAILDKLMKISVTEWTYISQDVETMNKYSTDGKVYTKSPVHIGPMAQDFATEFGYGEYEDKITTSDIDGVMFASIQALAEENVELKKTLSEQQVLLEELKKLVNELKQH